MDQWWPMDCLGRWEGKCINLILPLGKVTVEQTGTGKEVKWENDVRE
jgi:hypothetical protein